VGDPLQVNNNGYIKVRNENEERDSKFAVSYNLALNNKDTGLQGSMYNRNEKFPLIPSSLMTTLPKNVQ
jgi:hypothetical protein